MSTAPLDVATIRRRFPALARVVDGRPVAYLDGPGGTQVPEAVIEGMAAVHAAGVSNLGGTFAASLAADDITERARRAAADLVNGRPDEIVFGQNMTSLTFAVSRALARTWNPGDEVVVTRLDHDANITPWVVAARDAGAEVRWADVRPTSGCHLDMESVARAITPNTRLVAVTHASNAVGTIPDVAGVVRLARRVGALVYVDAVHYAPHGLIDVQELDCDFLVCSAYKFYGPHTGVLWGRYDLLDEIEAYKVVPAPDRPPGKWETGTQSFESLAGVEAAVEYLAGLGGTAGTRRQRLARAMDRIGEHERGLVRRFVSGLAGLDGVQLFGIGDERSRTPTFAIAVQRVAPGEVEKRLAERGVFVWSGHYYAVQIMERLGVLDGGGLVRIGFAHYNTVEEVDRVLADLARLAG